MFQHGGHLLKDQGSGVPLMGGGDTVAPTCVITSDAETPATAAFTLTVTFSEDVTGFVIGNITVAHASASAFTAVSAAVYTATITPIASDPADVTIEVAAGVCVDGAGNLNTASNILTIQRLYSYLVTLSPTFLLKYNETAGDAANSGSDGGSGSVSGATQGQVGQLGANTAYLFDGVDDIITFISASVTGTKNLTTQRWCFLFNPASMGESSNGRIVEFGNNIWLLTATNDIDFRLVGSTGTARAVTNMGSIATSTWQLIFVDYDDADVMGLGRHIRVFHATAASAAALMALGTDNVLIGTVTAQSADLLIGNNALTSRTFDGLRSIDFGGAGLWTPAGTPGDLTVLNRIRSLVFGV